MGFLDINLSGAQEPKAVPEGEYLIRWVDTNEGIDKNGHAYIMPLFDIPSEQFSKTFSFFAGLPHQEMTPKDLNATKFNLTRLFESFGIDHTKTIDYNSCKGKESWAILGVKDDDQYGKQNFVKKFVRPV
jgi:hypothetical protein